MEQYVMEETRVRNLQRGNSSLIMSLFLQYLFFEITVHWNCYKTLKFPNQCILCDIHKE